MKDNPKSIVALPSGILLKLTELHEIDVDIYMRDVIIEHILLTQYPEEPSHHTVYHDDKPIYIQI